MFLTDYFSENENGIKFSRRQASDFAKNIANDFNPIHDEDAKRFCVPGDLLFSLLLYKKGLSQHMRFEFSEMVTEDVALKIPVSTETKIAIYGDNGKKYLSVSQSGEATDNPDVIECLVRQYVAFSGQTFPHILVPLMEKHQVMINSSRPFVIYESMEIEFERIDFSTLELKMKNVELDVVGKRGYASFKFILMENGNAVGSGVKNMVLSGLRPYEQNKIDELIDIYNSAKRRCLNS